VAAGATLMQRSAGPDEPDSTPVVMCHRPPAAWCRCWRPWPVTASPFAVICSGGPTTWICRPVPPMTKAMITPWARGLVKPSATPSSPASVVTVNFWPVTLNDDSCSLVSDVTLVICAQKITARKVVGRVRWLRRPGSIEQQNPPGHLSPAPGQSLPGAGGPVQHPASGRPAGYPARGPRAVPPSTRGVPCPSASPPRSCSG
jgi:hypothetical protein